jgi:formylglycine-generating enzyme
MSWIRLLTLSVAVLVAARSADAVMIPTVVVGNPGNAADTRYLDSDHPNGVGSVGYPFRIGTTEVTNAQYVEFLNAVAATDTYGLYSPSTSTSAPNGISRSGSSGSYFYSVTEPAFSGTFTYDDGN